MWRHLAYSSKEGRSKGRLIWFSICCCWSLFETIRYQKITYGIFAIFYIGAIHDDSAVLSDFQRLESLQKINRKWNSKNKELSKTYLNIRQLTKANFCSFGFSYLRSIGTRSLEFDPIHLGLSIFHLSILHQSASVFAFSTFANMNFMHRKRRRGM